MYPDNNNRNDTSYKLPLPAITEGSTTRPIDRISYSEPHLGQTSAHEVTERVAFSSSSPAEYDSQGDRLRFAPFSIDGDNSQCMPHDMPLPPVPPQVHVEGSEKMAEHPDPRRTPLSVRRESRRLQSGIDWIVPLSSSGEKMAPFREKTVGERLEPTLTTAIEEKDKYALNAKMTGYALNLTIGLQVLLGSLTTGLAVVVNGRQAQVTTAVLGGFSTLVASYLARARGSNEPELSIARVKDLEQFIRECQAFKLDHGHDAGSKYDDNIIRFRDRFEELLGNANGERKLSPPV